jgi:hypothetical protein
MKLYTQEAPPAALKAYAAALICLMEKGHHIIDGGLGLYHPTECQTFARMYIWGVPKDEDSPRVLWTENFVEMPHGWGAGLIDTDISWKLKRNPTLPLSFASGYWV